MKSEEKLKRMGSYHLMMHGEWLRIIEKIFKKLAGVITNIFFNINSFQLLIHNLKH